MNKASKWLRGVGVLMFAFVMAMLYIPKAYASDYWYYDYEIENYHVDIIANADNTYEITESIEVYFNEWRHGIYRTIPKQFNDIRTRVKNFDAGDVKTKVVQLPGSFYARMGDPDETVIAEQNYTLRYTLDMGEDQGAGVDSVYLDVIGFEWGTVIHNASFTLDVSAFENVPKDIYAYAGYEGSSETESMVVQTFDDRITGYTTRLLQPYEGITIKVDMPEGTMATAKNPLDMVKIIALGSALLSLILLFRIRMKYRNKTKIEPVVTFHAPDDMNPVELGYVIDEFVDNEDVGALIIYWASKGYLRIEEQKHHKFVLHKTGEMGVSYRKYEIDAFKKLFALGDGTKVESKDLHNTYYSQVATIKTNAAKPFESGTKELYTTKSKTAKGFMQFVGMLVMFMLGLLSTIASPNYQSDAVMTGIFLGFFFSGIYFFLCIWYERLQKRRKKRGNLLTAFLILMSLVLYIVLFFILIAIVSDSLFFGEIFALSIAALIILFVSPRIKQHTEYGRELLQKVYGFRNFLKAAEEDRIKVLINESPTYVFDVLPYAIVLGVSDEWSKKFEAITTEAPGWYTPYGMRTFSAVALANSMTSTTRSMSSVASSRPSSSGSSSGGFSSGGGFSGGGGGGGGGGSW